MKRVLLLVSSAIVIFGCSKAPEQTTSTVSATTATQSASASSTTSATPAPAPVPASAPAPAPQPSAGALASQETNWKGVTAEVTEFRRKGNTLTAKVRFSSRAAEEATPMIMYNEVYLIDTAGGKKYQVLQDEKKAYIAALRQGYEDRWYEHMKTGDTQVIWIKFPTPPPEVKSITLQLPNTPPFEDLKIQE